MFLHLGGNTIVRTKDVIAIVNAENGHSTQAIGPPAKGPAKSIGTDTKAIIITDKAVYLSPISSGTLKKRAEYLAGVNGH